MLARGAVSFVTHPGAAVVALVVGRDEVAVYWLAVRCVQLSCPAAQPNAARAAHLLLWHMYYTYIASRGGRFYS